MAFFDTLRRVLGGDAAAPSSASTVRQGAGLSESESAAPHELSSAYDRAQWHKKLKRILNALLDAPVEPTEASQKPEEEARDFAREWDDLMNDAKALEFEPEWVAHCQREEFLLLIHRAVSDRVVTEREHSNLDRARALIGMTDAEAEAALHAVMAEAESFFDKPVTEN